MLSWRKPSAESTRRFLTAQAKLDFSYSAVGATANPASSRFRRGSNPHQAGRRRAGIPDRNSRIAAVEAVRPGLAGGGRPNSRVISRHLAVDRATFYISPVGWPSRIGQDPANPSYRPGNSLQKGLSVKSEFRPHRLGHGTFPWKFLRNRTSPKPTLCSAPRRIARRCSPSPPASGPVSRSRRGSAANCLDLIQAPLDAPASIPPCAARTSRRPAVTRTGWPGRQSTEQKPR